jgi:hypothetical protein
MCEAARETNQSSLRDSVDHFQRTRHSKWRVNIGRRFAALPAALTPAGQRIMHFDRSKWAGEVKGKLRAVFGMAVDGGGVLWL